MPKLKKHHVHVLDLAQSLYLYVFIQKIYFGTWEHMLCLGKNIMKYQKNLEQKFHAYTTTFYVLTSSFGKKTTNLC
jgi:hypothetical protein